MKHSRAIGVLIFIGVGISTYLSAYQLGVINSVWDPLFGPTSSTTVLHSFISHLLPLPDAVFGVVGYAGEFVLNLAHASFGQKKRWLVILFGAVALAMALVGVGLIAMQAFVIKAWCLLCLFSAAISIVIAGLVYLEVHCSSIFTKRLLQCNEQ